MCWCAEERLGSGPGSFVLSAVLWPRFPVDAEETHRDSEEVAALAGEERAERNRAATDMKTRCCQARLSPLGALNKLHVWQRVSELDSVGEVQSHLLGGLALPRLAG